MELFSNLVDIFLHIDKHLGSLISDYGLWIYLLLFLIIFCETGLVVTPFLYGDSLLFAAGAFAAIGSLNVGLLSITLLIAAVLGDGINYAVGNLFGQRILKEKKVPFVKKKYLDRTHDFYERYGGKTIVIARFVPIVRTFAPFVAGIGAMNYARFLTFNIVGAVLWISIFIFGGYFFGNLPFAKQNFSFVILAIILISVAPIAYELLKKKLTKES